MTGDSKSEDRRETLALVGHPNVGKSLFFGRLTRRYVDVSNYPGTTVEISKGVARIQDREVEVIDTPGINSLIPVSEEERVARDLLYERDPSLVVQVADAKNIRRTLSLTIELAENDFPTVLALNMSDEAERKGIDIDIDRLSRILGIEVIRTVATTGEGFPRLRSRVFEARVPQVGVDYGETVEEAVDRISRRLTPTSVPPRGASLMLISGDQGLREQVGEELPESEVEEIDRQAREVRKSFSQPVSFFLNRKRREVAEAIADKVERSGNTEQGSLAETLSRLTMNPLSGIPIFLAVLWAVYQFVGVFGAQVAVDFLETRLFGDILNPGVRSFVQAHLPFGFLEQMLVGEYGLITMGLGWAIAIVLPVIVTFFLAFSILEDSGYLPRLSIMVDRVFRKIGLTGKAVLPMVLGLGCDTMATVTTRTLETRKERTIATLLLALGVPCSAQLGVILGLFAYASPAALLVWGSIIVLQLLLVGWLSSKLLKGRTSEFILEIPPLRFPRPLNVLRKTATRVQWFFKEVLPFFLVGTLMVFLAQRFGILGAMIEGMKPVVSGVLDLPEDTAVSFILGFVRRDYGTAGLFDLARSGALDPVQITVSAVVITLFVPCIANYLMIVKERGLKVAAGIVGFIIPFSISVGALLNLVLNGLGVGLS